VTDNREAQLREALQDLTDAAWGFMEDTGNQPYSLHLATHRAMRVLGAGSVTDNREVIETIRQKIHEGQRRHREDQ
jgi:hypothetical protein